MADAKITALTAYTPPIDTDVIPIVDVTTGGGTTKKITMASLRYAIQSAFNAPEGFLINGKIVPSVASNNLTVAIKGMDGNDPSATNPVYVRIGSVVRSITSALVLAANAGSSWLNMGSAELATKEVDLFVYLVWSSANSAVAAFLSRIPYANLVGDVVWSNTSEKGLLNSAGVTNVATDVCVNIGRFATTLSAGAGYTWTVPTFTASNLIQRPIYETRWLTWIPKAYGAGGSIGTYAQTVQNAIYKIRHDTAEQILEFIITNKGSWSGALFCTMPIGTSITSNSGYLNCWVNQAGTLPVGASRGMAYVNSATTLKFLSQTATAVVDLSVVANNDAIYGNFSYPL